MSIASGVGKAIVGVGKWGLKTAANLAFGGPKRALVSTLAIDQVALGGAGRGYVGDKISGYFDEKVQAGVDSLAHKTGLTDEQGNPNAFLQAFNDHWGKIASGIGSIGLYMVSPMLGKLAMFATAITCVYQLYQNYMAGSFDDVKGKLWDNNEPSVAQPITNSPFKLPVPTVPTPAPTLGR